MRKTWIKVKRGILEQKHIDKLGQAWYLYFYILDQADWESGKITGWKDEYAADDLGKPIGLIREHRKKLAIEKYIRYEKGQHDQTIIINNWTDPRRYDYHIINPDNESAEESEHSNGESLPQTSGQTSGQTILAPSQNNVPSYNHISHNHIEHISSSDDKPEPIRVPCDIDGIPDDWKEKPKKKQKHQPDPRYTHIAYSAFYSVTKRRPNAEMVDKVIEVLGDFPDVDRLRACYTEWIERGYNKMSYKWLTEWYVSGIQGSVNKTFSKTVAEKNDEFLKSEMAKEMEKINNGR